MLMTRYFPRPLNRNVRIWSDKSGTDKETVPHRVHEALKIVGIENLPTAFPII